MIPGKNGTVNPKIKCFHCNFHYHYANNCPKVTREGDKLAPGDANVQADQHLIIDEEICDLGSKETDNDYNSDWDETVYAMQNLMYRNHMYTKQDILLDTGSNCSVLLLVDMPLVYHS